MSSGSLPDQVSVLILGGTAHLSRPLLKWLLASPSKPEWKGPKIKHIRLADKFLIAGQASTTFVDQDTMEALKDPKVEYKQANLKIPSTLAKMYDHPEGGSYDIVFDFTGEGLVSINVPEELLLEKTKLAHSIATESAKRQVKAHIRDTVAFMTVDSNAAPMKESDTVKPKTARAYWWYETERAVASVPGLNLAITRSAEVVGPYVFTGTILCRFAFGCVYKYLGEPMKLLWGPDLRINTIHIDDWCPAAWQVALWVASHGRQECDRLAGEDLPPVRMKDKLQDSMREKVSEGCCPRTQTPRAPVFNIVDDTDLTQGKMLSMAGQYWGIETGFVNAAINAWARINLSSVVDEINERHSTAIAEIIQQNNLADCPLSGWLDVEMLANRALAFDNHKIKSIIGWYPRITLAIPHFEQIVNELRDLNMFPRESFALKKA